MDKKHKNKIELAFFITALIIVPLLAPPLEEVLAFNRPILVIQTISAVILVIYLIGLVQDRWSKL